MRSSRLSWMTFVLGSLSVLLWIATVAYAGDRAGSNPRLDQDVNPRLLISSGAAYAWLQFNGNPQHSGNNTLETTINAGNVVSLTKLFQSSLPSVADGAPVYLNGVQTSQGLKDLIFVTSKSGHILALDARTGVQVWGHQYPAGACRINGNNSRICYTTSSPAIDPNRQYVYSYGLDGKVHKFQAGDGTEILDNHWPETATLKPQDEKGSSALSIATASGGASYLYVANGGYPGDAGDYQGHVTAIDLAGGSQRVFNTMCSDQAVHFNYSAPDCAGVQSAIWARAGVVYISDTNKIYMATGNGTFDPGSHNWGDTVFELNPDGTGANGDPLNSYTPVNFQDLQNSDQDLGSTAPAYLPTAITSTVSHLAVQAGKDAVLRLIDLDKMSGAGGPGLTGGEVYSLAVPQGGEVLTALAVWVDPNDHSTWVFVVNGSGASALQVTYTAGGVPQLALRWQTGNSGSSPLVANNVLYYAGNNIIRAINPRTGSLLWHDSTYMGGVHWESPIVANGVLYITDESAHLTAYHLLTNQSPRFYLPLITR